MRQSKPCVGTLTVRLLMLFLYNYEQGTIPLLITARPCIVRSPALIRYCTLIAVVGRKYSTKSHHTFKLTGIRIIIWFRRKVQ